MIKSGRALLLTFIALFFSATAIAQEGHPLVGTWLGDWGPTADDRNFLTIIMYWDGKNITGIVNPGPDSSELKIAKLDSSTWTVAFEADVKDDAGQAHHLKANGKLDKIGTQTRTLAGIWEHDQGKGSFTLERQSGP
ncbi:MAG: hypothetical protein V4628_09330 [Pseudomonadota bacterium]